jgi:hypothetical protein
VDHAVNRAPVSHEMSTKGVGTMLSTDRGSLIGKHGEPVGLEARNAFTYGSDYEYGAQGDTGINDACNNTFDEDWD